MNLRTCFNWKILVGVGIVVLAMVAFAPNLVWAAVPFLLLLLCPLMMFVMMRGMGGMGSMGSGHSDMSAMGTSDAPAPQGSRAERLAELKARNDALAREIAALEDGETAVAVAPPVDTSRERTGVPV